MLEKLRATLGLWGMLQALLVVLLGGAAVVGLIVHPLLWQPRLVFSTTRVTAHAALTFLGLGVALPLLAMVVARVPVLEHRTWICVGFHVTGLACLLFAAASSWP